MKRMNESTVMKTSLLLFILLTLPSFSYSEELDKKEDVIFYNAPGYYETYEYLNVYDNIDTKFDYFRYLADFPGWYKMLINISSTKVVDASSSTSIANMLCGSIVPIGNLPCYTGGTTGYMNCNLNDIIGNVHCSNTPVSIAWEFVDCSGNTGFCSFCSSAGDTDISLNTTKILLGNSAPIWENYPSEIDISACSNHWLNRLNITLRTDNKGAFCIGGNYGDIGAVCYDLVEGAAQALSGNSPILNITLVAQPRFLGTSQSLETTHCAPVTKNIVCDLKQYGTVVPCNNDTSYIKVVGRIDQAITETNITDNSQKYTATSAGIPDAQLPPKWCFNPTLQVAQAPLGSVCSYSYKCDSHCCAFNPVADDQYYIAANKDSGVCSEPTNYDPVMMVDTNSSGAPCGFPEGATCSGSFQCGSLCCGVRNNNDLTGVCCEHHSDKTNAICRDASLNRFCKAISTVS